jgi:hypothetical protein
MEAIRNHWDSNHILAHNKDFFLYMFGGDKNNINMILAEDVSTHNMAGFLGYFKYTATMPFDVALVMWKAITNRGMLGLSMLQHLIDNLQPRFIFSVGINPDTAMPIYKALHFYTGKLDHYYRISDNNEYKIAQIIKKYILPVTSSELDVLNIETPEIFDYTIELDSRDRKYPYKDNEYFYHRFFHYPIYKYIVYAIISKGKKKARAFFVGREIEKFGVKIFRIVEYIGSEGYFAGISVPLQNLMVEKNYEYIDCYCYGMSEATMNAAGLIRRTEEDKNIIPNFFEPFLCKNGDIYYCSNKADDFRFFKADADQDQPRLKDRTL